MKKHITMALSAAMLLASCGAGNENATSGGFLGAQLGSIIGSAIGGISGGPRGSDIGTLIGMAGGAAVGAAVGSTADKANQQKYDEYKAQRQQQRIRAQQQNQTYSLQQSDTDSDSGFDPSNSGNDIITLDTPDSIAECKPHSGTMMMEEASIPALSIRNVRYVGNGMTLTSNELAKVTVEVYNNSTSSLYNVQPTVIETTGNKHIFVSAPIIIEKIAPGKGIRYTAMVKADNRLKDGTAHFKVFASEKAGGHQSEATEFDITTKR